MRQTDTANQANSNHLPAWLAKAAASGVAGIGIQGWGPGASGIFIRYLYNPYGTALASRQWDDLRKGSVISRAGYASSQALSQGGASYVVLTFRDGTSIDVDTAVPVATGVRLTGALANTSTQPQVYYIHATFISPQGSEKDDAGRAFCVVDRSGDLASVRLAVFSAMAGIEPGAASPGTSGAGWLRQLRADAVAGYAATGNDGTRPFTRALSAQTVNAKLQHLLPALRRARVLTPASVRSTQYGFRSWGRTHARSLTILLNDGSTVNLNAGYALSKPGRPLRTDPNLFRVTYTTVWKTTSLFVEDESGTLHQAWELASD
ncbi:MAG: hypothetical protein IRZ33_09985 [Alicyclobacillaceae bacterium]|nr:hypothetical protein [Alicyclobacillaceae bacterium]